MLIIFKKFSDFVVYELLNLTPGIRFSESLNFFIEDITKIFFLLIVMIYGVAFLRASLNVERVRTYLKGKNRFLGYFLGSTFGAVTPFCSCSGTPLFLAFTQARIPVGITMAFLVTSPIINEVAVILLASILGLRFLIIYVSVGMLAGILSGIFMDFIKAEKYLTPLVNVMTKGSYDLQEPGVVKKISFKERHLFAKEELRVIFNRVWKWIILGILIGAVLHGYVPESFIIKNLSSKQLWTVPAAVLLGIPLYSNTTGVVPIAESLLNKGLPIGTTLAFMMSTVAASFPEFMILKQVMKPKLLFIFFLMLLVLFVIVGFLFNFLF